MKYVFVLLLLSSCMTYKTVPIKGEYTNGNYEAYTEKSKDQVWDNVIDFFAKRGLTIKIIDRSSGLIISGETALAYTIEKTNGQLENSNADVVIARVINPTNKLPVRPYQVYAEWNVRIKEVQGKTLINVNLVNPGYVLDMIHTERTNFTRGYIQSLGNFEKMIYEQIK